MQQIRQAFTLTSESQIHSVLYAHCLLSAENSKRPDLLKRLKYSDLCKKLGQKHAVPCLLTILEVSVDLLKNYVAMVRFHEAAKPVDAAQEKFYSDILSGKFALFCFWLCNLLADLVASSLDLHPPCTCSGWNLCHF